MMCYIPLFFEPQDLIYVSREILDRFKVSFDSVESRLEGNDVIRF